MKKKEICSCYVEEVVVSSTSRKLLPIYGFPSMPCDVAIIRNRVDFLPNDRFNTVCVCCVCCVCIVFDGFKGTK
jgi:hypothetical protein